MKGTDLPVPMESEPVNFTLDPLRTEGPDALDTRQSDRIKRAMLRKLEYVQNNAYHQVTTKQAHDLFAAAASDPACPGPLPPDATPVAATIAVHLEESPGTNTVEIRPPATVKIDPPTHASVILAWLSKSCLNAARKLVRLAPILLLALASAISPALDDDNDDDDSDSDRHASFSL